MLSVVLKGSPEHLEDGVLDVSPLEVRVLVFKLGDEVVAEHLKQKRGYL